MFDGSARTLVTAKRAGAAERSTCQLERSAGGPLVARAMAAGLVRDDIEIDDVLDGGNVQQFSAVTRIAQDGCEHHHFGVHRRVEAAAAWASSGRVGFELGVSVVDRRGQLPAAPRLDYLVGVDKGLPRVS